MVVAFEMPIINTKLIVNSICLITNHFWIYKNVKAFYISCMNLYFRSDTPHVLRALMHQVCHNYSMDKYLNPKLVTMDLRL